MDYAISVRPVAGGWRVHCEGLVDQVFLSGASAEAKANSLASTFAGLGYDVRLMVYDTTDGLIATRRLFASNLSAAEDLRAQPRGSDQQGAA